MFGRRFSGAIERFTTQATRTATTKTSNAPSAATNDILLFHFFHQRFFLQPLQSLLLEFVILISLQLPECPFAARFSLNTGTGLLCLALLLSWFFLQRDISLAE